MEGSKNGSGFEWTKINSVNNIERTLDVKTPWVVVMAGGRLKDERNAYRVRREESQSMEDWDEKTFAVASVEVSCVEGRQMFSESGKDQRAITKRRKFSSWARISSLCLVSHDCDKKYSVWYMPALSKSTR